MATSPSRGGFGGARIVDLTEIERLLGPYTHHDRQITLTHPDKDDFMLTSDIQVSPPTTPSGRIDV